MILFLLSYSTFKNWALYPLIAASHHLLQPFHRPVLLSAPPGPRESMGFKHCCSNPPFISGLSLLATINHTRLLPPSNLCTLSGCLGYLHQHKPVRGEPCCLPIDSGSYTCALPAPPVLLYPACNVCFGMQVTVVFSQMKLEIIATCATEEGGNTWFEMTGCRAVVRRT